MKKPVLTEMTPDVIRKGTLSMVLSALQSQPKTESGKKPATTESQASADQTTTGSSGGSFTLLSFIRNHVILLDSPVFYYIVSVSRVFFFGINKHLELTDLVVFLHICNYYAM